MKGATKAIVVAGAAFSLLLLGYFQGYLHGMTGGLSGALADANKVNADNLARLRGSKKNFVGVLDIEVKEKPFGMHLRRGSVIVEEVFPGFPAEKLGVREGCSIERIAGELIKQGTWLETFQKTPTPFKMTFVCPPQSNTGQGPMTADKHDYRVMVVKRPFGMNVQVNKVPRVVEVLPGSAAERAGVKAGFVLTHVQEQKVDKDTWFDAWQHAPLPAVLTFDTDMPLNDNNKFFNSGDTGLIPVETPGLHAPHANLPDEWHEDDVPVPGFDEVRVSVKELPFGMHVDAPPGKLPIVKRVTPKLPADVAGVKAGDVLLKVAGHRVDSSTWYSAFQHAVPPFGLHFRRPHATVSSGKSDVLLPVMPTFGEMVVNVTKRPFGMKVKRGSNVVQDVFAGFPSQKAGVRKGCEIRQIAGKTFSQGTWMNLFQKAKLPFQLKLFCGKAPKDAKAVAPSVLVDEHNFRVVVKERPFGMNVQTNTVPRVVEVLPGYPAEAAGVKAGYVLTAINDQPVDAHTWFDIWTDSPPGTVLTFDTNMPMSADNPFLSADDAEEPEKEEAEEDEAKSPDVDHQDVKQGYSDFRAAVKKLPFGMLLKAPKGGRPTVNKIVKGSPAEQVGIKLGDVLVEVAGLPVDTKTWFKAFQQAVPPFGLHFRRPDATARDTASQASEKTEK